MLRQLNLENITCYKKKEFKFSDITVFFAPDGYGKSTIVSAIRQALSGSDETKEAKDLIRKGYGSGQFTLNMFVNNHTYEITKKISDKVATVGLTPQKLAGELGITKSALELLVDSWTILRKSESELATMIEKALNPNMSKDDIINKILEQIKEDKRAIYRPILSDCIARATGDTLTTLERKLDQRKKEIATGIQNDRTTVSDFTEKLKRTKELNLEKVKAAKAKSDQVALIGSREKEIAELKETEKTQKETVTTKKTAAKDKKIIDTDETNKEIGKLELQIADATKQVNAIPDVVDLETQNLPCKWFGKCGLDPDTILEMHEKSKVSNKDKKSKLQNQIVLLQEELTKLNTKKTTDTLENAKTEQAQQELKDAEDELKSTVDNIARIEKLVKELNDSLPKDVEDVGSTLMTMAEEVEEWTKTLTNSESAIGNKEKDKVIIDELIVAMDTTKTSLRTNRLESFKKNVTEAVASIFGCTVDYKEDGLIVDGLRHNLLSMSQQHRVGIAIQYAMAKSTGLPLMVIDNMNVITEYGNIVPLIQKAIGEGIQVVVFSSLPTIKNLLVAPEGKSLNIITIEKPVKDEEENATATDTPKEASTW